MNDRRGKNVGTKPRYKTAPHAELDEGTDQGTKKSGMIERTAAVVSADPTMFQSSTSPRSTTGFANTTKTAQHKPDRDTGRSPISSPLARKFGSGRVVRSTSPRRLE